MKPVAVTAAVVFLLDQVTKIAVVHGMRLDQVGAIDVLPPWLQFRMAWNQGVNFGLLSNEADVARWGLIVLALGISAWVWVWIGKSRHGRLARIGAGLLIGGALGNVIDRILYGAVADFLNMGLPGFQNPYSFNVADIAIFAGALALVLFAGEAKPPAKRREAP
ncbi:signal peptidase II [Frigidibacter sp. MR17.14]|uniref:signal peptidase II n=1 Tax=Frigidibacter sp. MR17.14 TaxID=3126509 RepID=UPI0030130ACB